MKTYMSMKGQVFVLTAWKKVFSRGQLLGFNFKLQKSRFNIRGHKTLVLLAVTVLKNLNLSFLHLRLLLF